VTAQPSVRAPDRQRRSQATFESILAAAGSRIDEIGVEATTMDAIARRAGVSIGAVYRFFENREAVVATLTGRLRARIQEAALLQYSEESLERDADAVVTDFLRGFRRALDEVPGSRGLLTAVFAQPTVDESMLWTAHVERFVERYAPGLRPARRRQAAFTYQVITAALVTGASAPRLQEARSVLLGYIRQLAREAAGE
jgi:AcrR family transcriptional regulator